MRQKCHQNHSNAYWLDGQSVLDYIHRRFTTTFAWRANIVVNLNNVKLACHEFEAYGWKVSHVEQTAEGFAVHAFRPHGRSKPVLAAAV